jgi:DUF4097 and DUF4098 domain-containing protein YvlB
MNRIETKIIIMVTNQLAPAKESDTKTEMIEEVSENLYQRYLELAGQGMPEDEALERAMETLGDVGELLTFLRESEEEGGDAEHVQEGRAQAEGAKPEEVRAENARAGEARTEAVTEEGSDARGKDTAPEGGSDARADDAAPEEGSDARTDDAATDAEGGSGAQKENGRQERDWSAEFKRDLESGIKDLESGIDAFVNLALDKAKVAQDIAFDTAKVAQETAKATVVHAKGVAKDVTEQWKDVSEQWKERYPDGVFSQYEGARGQKSECTAVAVTDAIHSLDIRLMNGDVLVRVVDKDDTYIEVDGDTQEVDTVLRDDGVLSIVQENTASASFFFLRGMRHCNIVVRLPKKVWNRVSVSTVNGDVSIEQELECQELHVSTASGDILMSRVVGDNVVCHSGSGDIDVKDLAGNLYAATKSGDVTVRGRLGRCELRSISGDVEFFGGGSEALCSSTSGDVQVKLENVPRKVEATSVSGDCAVELPRGDGMHVSYRTVSGDFSTNLPLTANMTKKRGETTIGDGALSRVSVSSTSGDVQIFVS